MTPEHAIRITRAYYSSRSVVLSAWSGILLLMAVADEIFGPVLSVVRASRYDEALQIVSQNPYGNGTAIFTNDGERPGDSPTFAASRARTSTPAARPSPPAGWTPATAAIVAACVLVMAVQGVWLRHGLETGWVDTVVDAKV